MKEFAKFFARRYSAVHADDDQQLQANGAVAVNLQSATANIDRRKSLKAKHSVNASGILNSFFNERTISKRSRSPKCKCKKRS